MKEYNQKMISEKMAFWTRIEELQNEHQKILKQTVEMWKKKEAVALRKQQELKKENSILSEQLSSYKIFFIRRD